MNTNIQLFKNDKFGEVRVTEINGEPYFVGNDVAKALGYEKPSNAISQHVEEDDTLKQGIMDNLGRNQDTIVINESGVYSLIFSSKLPKAKEFKHWVTSEVLPSIRKHGGYITSKLEDTEESIMARALVIAQATIERNKMQLKQANSTIMEQAPKVEYYDKCLESKGYLTVNMIAAELGISHIKLNKLLCEWDVQYKQTDCYFLHSQYRNRGYTVHRPYPYIDSHGDTKTRQHMYWMELGKKFIIELYYKKIAA